MDDILDTIGNYVINTVFKSAICCLFWITRTFFFSLISAYPLKWMWNMSFATLEYIPRTGAIFPFAIVFIAVSLYVFPVYVGKMFLSGKSL